MGTVARMGPEISDVVVDYDPETLVRRPVRKADALRALTQAPRWARRIVESIPEEGGILDPDAVDRMLVACHSELQRLWEELRHPTRVEMLLRPVVSALLEAGLTAPLRVVDVGCGPAFVLRWLSSRRVLEGKVRYIGADYNAALIDRAKRLAKAEALDVELVTANAFTLSEPADIILSSGVLHHFRGADLRRFFGAQHAAAPKAFLHFDIQASWAAPMGAWLFHRARMREPIARYDGTLSARRAHPSSTLLQVARDESPGMSVGHYAPGIPWMPVVRTIHGVVGIRTPFMPAVRAAVPTHIPMAWS